MATRDFVHVETMSKDLGMGGVEVRLYARNSKLPNESDGIELLRRQRDALLEFAAAMGAALGEGGAS
jgi:hypothetical protein